MGYGALSLPVDLSSRPSTEDLRLQLRGQGVPLLDVSELEVRHRGTEPKLELRPGALLDELSWGSVGAIVGAWSSGKTSLALTEVAEVTRGGGRAAVVDGKGWLFPPAVALLGGRLDRILILTPPSERAVWAAEQLLRSGVFDLTLLLEPKRLPRAALRRLQLAAERGDVRGLVVRQGATDVELASLRLRVETVPFQGKRASTIAAPPRACRVQLARRGSEGAGPPRRAEVALA
jgi:hypothetical protein